MKRWFKQLLSLTCALALFSSLNFALAFTDVPNSHWASNEIQFIVNKGLFNGTTATTFSPDAQMKRGQLAAVLYRYAGSPAVTGESGYGDVTTGAYYADACAWAKANGIFMAEKLNAANLNPDEGITRSEFAVMLYNFAKLNGKADVKSNASNPYTDMKNVSEEIQTAVIGWAVPAGILGGTTDTTMNPYGAIKRAHVAAMLYRYETKIANPGSEPAPTKPTTEPKPAETTPTTTPTTAKSTYGAGDTVAPMNGGAYTVEIGVGEKCYMDGSKLRGDWTEYYANKWNEAGKEIAQAPWDSAKGMAAITGLAVGTTTIEYLSTADYKTVLATIKVIVTEAGTGSGSGSTTGSGSTSRTEQDVYNAIIALKSQYPEGMTWTDDNKFGGNGGCAAFGSICAYAAFGQSNHNRVIDGYMGAKVGDRIRHDGHTVVVLENHEDYYVVAEGNYDGKIHWGRKIPFEAFESRGPAYIWTNW